MKVNLNMDFRKAKENSQLTVGIIIRATSKKEKEMAKAQGFLKMYTEKIVY